MKTQKIVNLLNGSDNENLRFATKKGYIIDSESNGNYSKDEEIKFLIMETQKIVNLLNGSNNENSKFATKKWYVIDSESKGNYSHLSPIKYLTKSIESSFCDYSDAYILVTGNISVTKTIAVPAGSPAGTQPQRKQPLDAATQVIFKNCAPFEKCFNEIDGTLVDET